jgi:hypothetical protein
LLPAAARPLSLPNWSVSDNARQEELKPTDDSAQELDHQADDDEHEGGGWDMERDEGLEDEGVGGLADDAIEDWD